MRQLACGNAQRPLEQLQVLRVWLVLHRQRLGIVRTAALHGFLALLYAALVIIFTVVNTILTLVNDTVTVALPVEQFWPETYPWIGLSPAPPASVVGGGFTTADVMVEGLG